MAARQQPVEAGADEHHHIGLLHDGRATGQRADRAVVGQYALGHRHGQIGDAGFVDQLLEQVFDACICGSLADKQGGAAGAGDKPGSAGHRLGGRRHGRGEVDRLKEQTFSDIAVDYLTQTRGGHVEIYAAGTARDSGAVCAHHCSGYILGAVYAVSGFYERLGDGELVEGLIVALAQIDGLALA